MVRPVLSEKSFSESAAGQQLVALSTANGGDLRSNSGSLYAHPISANSFWILTTILPSWLAIMATRFLAISQSSNLNKRQRTSTVYVVRSVFLTPGMDRHLSASGPPYPLPTKSKDCAQSSPVRGKRMPPTATKLQSLRFRSTAHEKLGKVPAA
jgi:hypothetical protein